jgi:hypothetical protein
MPDPFAEPSTPWWRRMWRRARTDGAPKRYAAPAGAIGPIVALMGGSAHGLDLAHRIVFAIALFGVPPALVEIWWKQHRRRDDERLLVLPEEQA